MKKLVSVILLLALMTSMCTIFASASSDERIIYNETGEKIIVRTIPLDEVPEGIIPLEVDSIAEADALIKNCTATHVAVSGAANNSLLRASGDALIDKIQYGGVFSSGTMVTELRVEYTTGYSDGTHIITWANPYTSTYGIPIFASFTETSCSGYIGSDKKDYYGTAHGQVDYYLLIEDSINWYTLPVSLSGWVALTR